MAVSSALVESLASKIPRTAILGPEACQQFAVEGRVPSLAVRPESVPHVSQALEWASAHRLAVVPWGGGTLMHLGYPPERYDVALKLDLLNQVVDYPAADMTITVQAGLCLGCLQKILARQGQYLPIDPPHASQATLGGLIAANAGGPRRLAEGTLRDLVIGLQVVQADGRVVKGGSRVVKNVAGYDLCKLYTGSFGSLGVIVEATLKLRLLPEVEASVWCEFESPAAAESALASILNSELSPVFLEYFNGAGATAVGPSSPGSPDRGRPALLVAVDGPAEAAVWQKDRLRSVLKSQQPDLSLELAGEVQKEVRGRLFEFRAHPQAVLVGKANILSSEVTRFVDRAEKAAAEKAVTLEAQSHAANGIVYLRARSALAEIQQVELVRAWTRLAEESGGSFVTERAEAGVKAQVNVWGTPRADYRVMKAIQETLDPQRALNPGRFVGRL